MDNIMAGLNMLQEENQELQGTIVRLQKNQAYITPSGVQNHIKETRISLQENCTKLQGFITNCILSFTSSRYGIQQMRPKLGL